MIDREVFYEIAPDDSSLTFSVERWFIPMDDKLESWTGLALCFGESVVLCSKKRAGEVWSAISEASR